MAGSSVVVMVDTMEEEIAMREKKGGEDVVRKGPSVSSPPLSNDSAELRLRRVNMWASIIKAKSRFSEMNHPVGKTTVLIGTETKQSSPAMTPTGDTVRRSQSSAKNVASEEEEDEAYKPEVVAKEKKNLFSCRATVEWIVFLLIMGCLVCSLTVSRLKQHRIWDLELWKWSLMVLVVFSGRLVTGWLISLIVYLIEKNFMLRTRLLYFVYGMRKSVQVCLWIGLVLLSWSLLFDHIKVERSARSHRALSFISRLFSSFLIASFIWMVKTLLVKALASSFHVKTYFDRIQESLFQQYVVETLSRPAPLMDSLLSESPKLTVNIEKAEGKQVDGIDVGKIQRLNQDKVSAWTMTRLINLITSSRLSTISSAIDDSAYNGTGTEINSEWEARAAADGIFRNVAQPDSKFIFPGDLLKFLTEDEVKRVFPQFQGAVEMGKIKRSAFRNWVVRVYMERKSLAHSLNDTKTAVKQLHKIAIAVVLVLIIIVWLLLMGFATTKVLVFISSQLLLVGFMFGNTCKTIFESIIFVFVMHPFDVGDRCVIDGVQMIVEEMNILTTVFLRFDNEKIFYPNSVLLTKPISNFYRSPDMGDNVEFSIDVSTPLELIGSLKTKIHMYLESKPQHWHPKHSVVVKEIENLNKMKMILYVLHTMNHQNIVEKNNRRTELVLQLKKIFEELNIQYHLLPQEVHLTTTEFQQTRSMTV